MMNKTRRMNRLGMVALLCVTLGVGILFAGCGQAPQDEKKAVTKVETKAPAVTVTPVETPEKQAAPDVAKQPAKAVAQEETAAPVKKVEAQGDLIDLYQTISKARSSDSKPTPQEETAFEERWKSLLEKNGQPLTMCDEVSLVAGSFKKPEKDAIAFTKLFLLFRVTKAFDKDYPVAVEAYVDPSHVNRLIVESDRPLGYARWSIDPKPPTSKWKAESLSIGEGSYMLQVRDVEAAQIPYKIRVAISSGPDGQWAIIGKWAELPWMLPE